MKVPAIRGVIDRRVLVNYRVDPDVLAQTIPSGFTPALVDGWGIGGICVIRLRGIRPSLLPAGPGLRSENAAHRIAVTLDDGSEGVYIPRRDTNSRLNTLVGGRLFPGVHHHAEFTSNETPDRIEVRMVSDDGRTSVAVNGRPVDHLPEGSVFGGVQEASEFFERGSVGYSDTAEPSRFDALELKTQTWEVKPLAVDQVQSSFFEDASRFPSGTAVVDNALLMTGIRHEWRARESLYCTQPEVGGGF